MGEIIGPICLATLFVICYLFVKSFPVEGHIQPGLLRIAIIALGPIVWNMAFLITLFLLSVFLGPCVSGLFDSGLGGMTEREGGDQGVARKGWWERRGKAEEADLFTEGRTDGGGGSTALTNRGAERSGVALALGQRASSLDRRDGQEWWSP